MKRTARRPAENAGKRNRVALAASALLAFAGAARAAMPAMDSTRGEQLFRSLSCIECHSVNGRGGKIGPDLGRRVGRNFTPATLASTMWNHAPVMWAAMRARGVETPHLDEQGAADLFAWFYSARFFERLGDAGRGKALFSEKHCAECHGLTDAKLAAAKPVSQWEALGHPVALVDALWNHAAAMREEFARRKFSWPELTSQDLADILVYLRNAPGVNAPAAGFELGSADQGQALFGSKGCAACHMGKRAPGALVRGQTLTDVAVDMWNHAPRMGPSAPSLSQQEMRDVTTYLWAQQFFTDSGDAAAGRRVFAAKRCATCHDSGAAPKLPAGPGPVTGASMVAVLWQHGPQMLDQMKSKSIPWPRFDGDQMSNLIAYLNSRANSK